jgi:hypothetical protein
MTYGFKSDPMERHYKTRCTIPMINRTTGDVDFQITLYGITVRDISSVPNDVITSLARRYPDHVSSLFLCRNGV